MDGRTDGRRDGRTKSPCSIGHRPLQGRCPKREEGKRERKGRRRIREKKKTKKNVKEKKKKKKKKVKEKKKKGNLKIAMKIQERRHRRPKNPVLPEVKALLKNGAIGADDSD